MSTWNRRDLGVASVGGLLAAGSPGGQPAAAPAGRRLHAVSQAMAEAVDAGRTAGVVTLVAQHGQLLHLDAVGRRDLASGAPMTADTIFRIASMTKPVTAVAMLMLREEGRWRFDDPVSRYVPGFDRLVVARPDGRSEPMVREMTMLDLMRHTAGLAYVVLDDPVDRLYREQDILDPHSDLATMIGKLAKLPLAFQPGARWYYSIGVDIQGYIIEQLSGQPLDAFFQQRIFGPLGMADTGFHVPEDKAERLAGLYVYDDQGRLTPKADRLAPTARPGLMSGGAGLYSTAQDYWRFCQLMLNGGEFEGARLLGAPAVSEMRRDQLPPGVTYGLFGPEPGQGFGLNGAVMIDPAAARSPMGAGSYWWGGGFGTWFSIDPVHGIIVIGMNQLTDSAALTSAQLRDRSTDLAYAALVSA